MHTRHGRGARASAAFVALALVAGALLGGCTAEPDEDLRSVVREYAAAWSGGDPKTLGELTDDPTTARKQSAEMQRRLGAWDTDVRVRGRASCGLGGCEQEYRVTHQVPGVGTWTYDTTVQLRERDDEWRVRWSRANFHPRLEDGASLRTVQASRDARTSATLLTVDKQPLADTADVPDSLHRMAARGGAVELVRPSGENETLFRPEPSQERIRLTLSPAVQQAAESALAGTGGGGSIVALRASTGEVLAAAGDGALDGRYEVGSVFRVISAAALIERGLDTSERVSCPKRATAGGRTFRNPGGEARDVGRFWEAFAAGCDTTIIARSESLPEGDLSGMAALFGFGGSWDTAVPTYVGRLPDSKEGRKRIAATAIGRDGVTASPLTMAGVAATVSAGRPPGPYLIAGEANSTGKPLPDGVLTRVRGLMRAGVTIGPATELETSEQNVHAVLGMVAGQPEQWIVGYRGDLAFAVRTKQDAVAVAERFLDRYS